MITWKTLLTVKQLSGGIVSITVTRTDDAEPESSWSYTIDNLDSNSVTIAKVANYIWSAWQDHITKAAAIKARKDSIENALSAALAAKEP